MNTIYLVRHGENVANVTKEFSYKLVDYSLTRKGIEQAEQTAYYFKDKNIQEIYASPLKRAQETAAIIAQELHLTVGVLEQFREVNVGTLEGKPPTAENWGIHYAITQDWIEGRGETMFPGGENNVMLQARMRAGLQIITHNKKQSNIIVVGHGGIFTHTIRDICSNIDIEQLQITENKNCSITTIELSTQTDPLQGTLKQWASYAHLHGYAAELLPGEPRFEVRT